MEKISPEQRIYIVEQYNLFRSIGNIAKDLGKANWTVHQVLKQEKVEIRSRSQAGRIVRELNPDIAYRKYDCNHSFFDDIQNEAQAYWLGFIAADGGVYEDSIFRIGLKVEDHHHLDRFRTAINSQHPIEIRYDRGKRDSGRDCCNITIGSVRLVRSLLKQGITPRKSETVQWSKTIPPLLVRHYARGYFDGDGGYSLCRSKREIQISIVGNIPFLLDFQQWLCSTCGLERTKLVKQKTPWLKNLRYGGTRQVVSISHFLYGGASVLLPRKLGALVEHLSLSKFLRKQYEKDLDYFTWLLHQSK